jgi:hypothetical protein
MHYTVVHTGVSVNGRKRRPGKPQMVRIGMSIARQLCTDHYPSVALLDTVVDSCPFTLKPNPRARVC